jgi:hypothetical protein
MKSKYIRKIIKIIIYNILNFLKYWFLSNDFPPSRSGKYGKSYIYVRLKDIDFLFT